MRIPTTGAATLLLVTASALVSSCAASSSSSSDTCSLGEVRVSNTSPKPGDVIRIYNVHPSCRSSTGLSVKFAIRDSSDHVATIGSATKLTRDGRFAARLAIPSATPPGQAHIVTIFHVCPDHQSCAGPAEAALMING